MKQRKLRNRLRLLIQGRESQTNRRVKQHDIATFVGVTDHTIINWIRNDVSKYEAHIIEGLCDYFGCDVSDLLYFEYVEVEPPD